jgi:hypothetical protein
MEYDDRWVEDMMSFQGCDALRLQRYYMGLEGDGYYDEPKVKAIQRYRERQRERIIEQQEMQRREAEEERHRQAETKREQQQIKYEIEAENWRSKKWLAARDLVLGSIPEKSSFEKFFFKAACQQAFIKIDKEDYRRKLAPGSATKGLIAYNEGEASENDYKLINLVQVAIIEQAENCTPFLGDWNDTQDLDTYLKSFMIQVTDRMKGSFARFLTKCDMQFDAHVKAVHKQLTSQGIKMAIDAFSLFLDGALEILTNKPVELKDIMKDTKEIVSPSKFVKIKESVSKQLTGEIFADKIKETSVNWLKDEAESSYNTIFTTITGLPESIDPLEELIAEGLNKFVGEEELKAINKGFRILNYIKKYAPFLIPTISSPTFPPIIIEKFLGIKDDDQPIKNNNDLAKEILKFLNSIPVPLLGSVITMLNLMLNWMICMCIDIDVRVEQLVYPYKRKYWSKKMNHIDYSLRVLATPMQRFGILLVAISDKSFERMFAINIRNTFQ